MKSYWQKWVMIRLVHAEQNAFINVPDHTEMLKLNIVLCIKPS